MLKKVALFAVAIRPHCGGHVIDRINDPGFREAHLNQCIPIESAVGKQLTTKLHLMGVFRITNARFFIFNPF